MVRSAVRNATVNGFTRRTDPGMGVDGQHQGNPRRLPTTALDQIKHDGES